MGRRGPPPTPTKLLVARGSRKPEKRGNEPDQAAGKPRCPSWIRPEAKLAWKRLTPILDEMGLLSTSDANAIARYCQTFARWKEAEQKLADHGSTLPVKDKEGALTGMVANPWVKIVERANEQLLALEQQFGLTPSARARLATDGHQKVDDLDAFVASKPKLQKSRFFKRNSG